MMLAITIEHAVTNPMVRFGGADLTAARWVSVVIRRNSIQTFLLQNAEQPRVSAQIKGKAASPFQSGFPLLHALLEHFRQLSEALQGISLHQHERTSQALRRNGHPTRSFPR